MSLNVIAPGVGDHDLQAGRLRDDRHVAGHAGANRREHALAAVLLRRHAGDENLATEPVREPCVDERLTAARIDATPPFMSTAPRPYRRSPSRSAAHGSRVHVAGSPDRHDVHVADEHDPPPATRPRDPPADRGARGRSGAGRAASPRRASRDRGARPRDPAPAAPPEARLGEQLGDQVLDRALVAGDARHPDEPRQRMERSVQRPPRRRRSLRGCVRSLALGSPASRDLARIGRVMHVGPPDPLTPISDAG